MDPSDVSSLGSDLTAPNWNGTLGSLGVLSEKSSEVVGAGVMSTKTEIGDLFNIGHLPRFQQFRGELGKSED